MPTVYKVYFFKKENFTYLKQKTKLQGLSIYMTSGKLKRVATSVDGAAPALQNPALSLITCILRLLVSVNVRHRGNEWLKYCPFSVYIAYYILK